MTDKSAELSCEGYATCHLSVDGGEAYAVNYISGSVIKFTGGKLVTHSGRGVHPTRQTAAHTHMAIVAPDKSMCWSPTWGWTRCSPTTATLTSFRARKYRRVTARAPCVLALRQVRLLRKRAGVVGVGVRVRGRQTRVYRHYALPCKRRKNTAAAIRLSADGKTLYISNRGENTLVSFAVDGASLKLKQKINCHGDFPRDFDITPCGRYIVCANQYTNNLTIFSLTGGEMRYVSSVNGIENPLCVTFYEAQQAANISD